jgi:riboflavin biosynthesis pyrimidine reductase
MASQSGPALQLPPALSSFYGSLYMRQPRTGLHVFSNFVSTLDGIVSLGVRGHRGGGDISGFSLQDRTVMGLLRAVADVVIVGAGVLAADPQHVWSAEGICPEFKTSYRQLRQRLGKQGPPLNVIVSASGHVDLKLPVFSGRQVPSVIMTTRAGAQQLGKQKAPSSVRVQILPSRAGAISARAILKALTGLKTGRRVLLEGGPQLLGDFYSQGCVDEQFLTLAPQIAGREHDDQRLNLVMGRTFAPRHPLWGELIDVRSGSALLFLRYSFGGSRDSKR